MMMMRAMVAGLVALLLIGDAIGQPQRQTPRSREPQSNPTQQVPAVNPQPPVQPPVEVQPLPPQKTEAERADETRERQERANLDRRLTEFTAGIADYTARLNDAMLAFGVATLILFLATTGLAVLAFLQSRALKISNTRAGNQIDLSRQALISAERPYLSCKDVHALGGTSGKTEDWKFYPVWENSGGTPPRQLYTASSWKSFTPVMPDHFEFPYLGQAPVQRPLVGPRATAWGAECLIPVSKLAEAYKGDCKIYLWGWVEYNDVFEGTSRHRTEYCMEVRVIGHPIYETNAQPCPFTYIRHPNHNGYDDECTRPLVTVRAV